MKRARNKIVKRSGIDWVVCAAGKSERFKQNTILKPKPMLNLLGSTMIERSISSLELLPGDQLIIITRKEDQLTKHLSSKLIIIYPWIKIVFIELLKPTSGQLETALAAQKYFRRDHGLAIWNCDTYFKSSEFLFALRESGELDGLIPCAQASGSAWSFVKTDKFNIATAIAEKKIISKNATVGLYYFSKTHFFIKHAKALLNKANTQKEIYVSALYDHLIQQGHRFKVVGCDLFLPFGTPEQVNKYWNVNLKQLLHDNPPGTVVVDLDNTLTIDDKELSYDKKRPRLDVIEKIRHYKRFGFKIIIYTARNMQTQHGDESLVIGNIGAVTLKWLERHKVPYDGIRFGKPYAQNSFYIDDKAIRPQEFVNSSYEELIELTK